MFCDHNRFKQVIYITNIWRISEYSKAKLQISKISTQKKPHRNESLTYQTIVTHLKQYFSGKLTAFNVYVSKTKNVLSH